MNLSETDKAYIAGFLDGEGSICLSKPKNRRTPHPLITLCNTHFGVMNWISKKLELRETAIYTYPEDTIRNHKIKYAVTIGRQAKIKEILENVFPYLIIKKRQAELMLEYLERRGCSQGMRYYVPSSNIIEIQNEIKALNKKEVN